MLDVMAFLRNAVLVAAALGFVAGVPLTAHAIEVECELKDGSTCTVSNDPVDSSSCMCADESGTGSTGDQEWADFDEEQLMEVCQAEVAFCEDDDSGGSTDTEPTAGGDTSDDTGDDSTGSSTGGAETTGDTSPTGTASGGSGPSTNPSDTDSNGTASGGDSDPGTTTGPEPGGDDEGGDGSSGGADEDNEDPSGCSVDTRGSSGGALLALFGLALGLRRRRVR